MIKTMKTIFYFCVLTLSLWVVGCNKSGSTVDTAKLEKSFDTAEPQQKSSVDRVVKSIRSKDYSGAMGELKQLASNAKLTPEQRQSIEDTLKRLQTEVTDAAKKAADDARQGLNNVLKK
jgi:hypothetical protein